MSENPENTPGTESAEPTAPVLTGPGGVVVNDLIGAASELTPEPAPAPIVHAPFTGIVNATGRRKTAVARVTLTAGKGVITVNGREFEDYFTTPVSRAVAVQPFIAVDGLKRFDAKVKTHGGGSTGQAGAVSLGIARALLLVDASYRPALKSKGLLTRDSREKERKKSGQPGARKRFQFSKR
ncbi:30S ribosomal protein S9 [Verrucomicrobia bacterium LW23]|nr:30S ribosomal protein S9 [Verrucomicrobia bacterium LW23]